MVNIVEVLEKNNELEKSKLYDREQLELIKYALYRENIDANLIMNPSIPSGYMETYINVATRKKTFLLKNTLMKKLFFR